MQINDLLSERKQTLLLMVFAGVAFSYLLGVMGMYGVYDGYLDHGEGIIISATADMLRGGEVYPSFRSANFTSNLYGPFLYLANGLMLWIFGANVAAGKLIGICAATASVILTAFSVREYGSRLVTYAVLAMSAYLLVCFPFSFWNRPDPLLMMMCALGVCVGRSHILERKPLISWIAMGILGGVACSLKIYGPLFILPGAMFVALRFKMPVAVICMGCVGIFVALIPFALPAFQLETYLEWFGIISTKSVNDEMVIKAFRYGSFFIIPPVLALLARWFDLRNATKFLMDRTVVYSLLSLLGISGCIYLASKPGAGMYYILPFAPICVDLMVRAAKGQDFRRFALWTTSLMIIVMLVTSIPIQKRFIRALEWDRTTAIKHDLHAIIEKNAGKTIQMGVGHSLAGYHNTLQKPELVLAGHPYTVDFGIMIETSFLKIPLPAPLIETIKRCETDIFLIPKGERPFEFIGYNGNKVVDKAFIDAFLANYRKSDTSLFYDLWSCNH